MEQIQFDDKNMMDDALASQKFITETYNTFANECSVPQLKEQFVNLLEDEHRIQHEVFTEMQKRGWYQTEPAEQDKINQEKQKNLGQMNQ